MTGSQVEAQTPAIETGLLGAAPPLDRWTVEYRRGFIAAKRTHHRMPLERVRDMLTRYGSTAPTNQRDPYLFGYRAYWFAVAQALI
jgi:hypothetical protein